VNLLKELRPDVGVLFAYAQLLPRTILRIPKAGVVNVHPSLLPRYRGPSPVQSAMLAGEAETGVSLMKITPRMDAGPIIAQERLPIGPRATAPELTATLARLGASLVEQHLEAWVAGEVLATRQDDRLATYCRLLTRDDGRLDWSQPAESLDRTVRALQPWPGTFTTWGGKVLKVMMTRVRDGNVIAPPGKVLTGLEPGMGAIAVATGSGSLLLEQVQLEGGRPMDGASFLRGQPALVGSTLGS